MGKDKLKRLETLFFGSGQAYFWICILGFALYARSLFFGFVYLDDNALILDNFSFIKNLGNIFKAFGEDAFFSTKDAYYRPLLTVSLMLNAVIGGQAPFVYHLTNIIIHLFAACLVLALFLKLKYSKWLAFFFSLVFVSHPVLTQAVAWIPGRNDSLLTVFILLSFYFLLEFVKSIKPKDCILHLLFFFLALFTKETALVFILVSFFYFLLIAKPALSNIQILPVGWGGVVAFWFLLRQIAFKNPVKYSLFDMAKGAVGSFQAILLYLGKVFFPFNLSVLPTLKDTTFIYGAVAVVLIIVFLLVSKKKGANFVWFGIVWFLFFLVPSFIRPNPDIAADFIEHRVYLPLIGLFIILMEIDIVKNLGKKQTKLLFLSGITIVVLAVINLSYSKNFKDKISFWENAVKTSPSLPLARRNLGAMYYLDGIRDKAEEEFHKALELNPAEPMAHNNLGLIYMDKNLLEKAEAEYKKELSINPSYDTAYFNLGLVYSKKNEFEKAIEMWEKTVLINPNYFSAHRNLASYYQQKKEFDKAARHLEVLKRSGQI